MTAWPRESDYADLRKEINHLVTRFVSDLTFEIVEVTDTSATLRGRIRANEHTASNKDLARYLEQTIVSAEGLHLDIEVTIWDQQLEKP